MVRSIYTRRGGRLSRLTAGEQAAVRNRYKSEQTEALAMLAAELPT
jgi:hypothetical protein